MVVLLDWHWSTKAGVFRLCCLQGGAVCILTLLGNTNTLHLLMILITAFEWKQSKAREKPLGSSWRRVKLCCLFMRPQSLIPLILQTTWQSLINHSFLCAAASGCSEFTYGQTYSISSFRRWVPACVCVCVCSQRDSMLLSDQVKSLLALTLVLLEILHLIWCFQSKMPVNL